MKGDREQQPKTAGEAVPDETPGDEALRRRTGLWKRQIEALLTFGGRSCAAVRERAIRSRDTEGTEAGRVRANPTVKTKKDGNGRT